MPPHLAHYREYPAPPPPWGVGQLSAAENVTYNTDLFSNAMFLAEIRNIQECGCYTESSILNLQRDTEMMKRSCRYAKYNLAKFLRYRLTSSDGRRLCCGEC